MKVFSSSNNISIFFTWGRSFITRCFRELLNPLPPLVICGVYWRIIRHPPPLPKIISFCSKYIEIFRILSLNTSIILLHFEKLSIVILKTCNSSRLHVFLVVFFVKYLLSPKGACIDKWTTSMVLLMQDAKAGKIKQFFVLQRNLKTNVLYHLLLNLLSRCILCVWNKWN